MKKPKIFEIEKLTKLSNKENTGPGNFSGENWAWNNFYFQIAKLRGQVINRASDSELENRLRTLTDTLIQKQTNIEGLSSDKSALGLELERFKADRNRQVKYFLIEKI